jgi:ATP-dependent helicase/nuclease subunit B
MTLFPASSAPRIFGLPCGAHFPEVLKAGLLERAAHFAPEELARTEIFVSSSRMRKDLQAAFDDGEFHFLPKIRLISEIGSGVSMRRIPMGVSGLRRRLELSQLVAKFLEQEPDFAARASIYDLADSLAALLAEMHDEGVEPRDLDEIDVNDTSGHWLRARQFISIISTFFDPSLDQPPMAEARLRMVVESLEADWQISPPQHPIIVAGSTGSRGTTAAFMRLVASLPQGAVVLPGVDFDMQADTWQKIEETSAFEHPQARFSQFAASAGIAPTDIAPWHADTAPNSARNRLVALSLQPAPVTDQWMKEGPKFTGLKQACQGMTLIEAPDARMEAVSIALALRRAAEEKKTAALVTPDRTLARHVTAVLDRWGISPDDSAGIPLNQTPPGRLLRHVAALMGRTPSSEQLLVLLKHPLVAQGISERGEEVRGFHLLYTRSLEVYMRRNSIAVPERASLFEWAERPDKSGGIDPAKLRWAGWACDLIDQLPQFSRQHLSVHLQDVSQLAEQLVSGPLSSDAKELWAQSAGREAARVMQEFEREAEYGGVMTPSEFNDVFRAVIGRGLARDPSPKHTGIMIWGTLEARNQGADLVILGGLNETIWPAAPAQDPWFSRDMRKQAGLLSPEQQVGLSAHDYQQSIGVEHVILSRAKRNAEAETVGARWLIRLTNLLAGMSDEGASELQDMRRRGDDLISMARLLDKPEQRVSAAHRPSPRPPLEARPRQLSVTRIETLIRDPYAIYASRILRLRKLDPLSRAPDPRDRGTAYHKVMEEFSLLECEESRAEAAARLMATAERVLDEAVLWPAARRMWLGRLRKIAHRLVDKEVARRVHGRPVAVEAKGAFHFPEIDFSLTCEADRIDETVGGEYIIYDYKTGAPPTLKQTETFKMQLHLEALMLENAKFGNLTPSRVYEVAYLGLDGNVGETCIRLMPGDTDRISEKLHELIRNYDNLEQGYTSRRAMQGVAFAGDFDQLARAGEWSDSDDATPEDVR